MSSLAALQGCGDDEEDNTSGGKGGTSGAAGEAGDGGTSGTPTGGRGGSAGSGGTTGGTGGSGPTGGTAGTMGGAGGEPGGGAGGEGGNGEGGGGTVDQARIDACGQYCTSYFSHMCETFDTNSYDDAADCQGTCEGSSWGIGAPGVAGTTIWCRISHADMASGADQELHCGHASENSTGVCN
jgi:hypothetical protein